MYVCMYGLCASGIFCSGWIAHSDSEAAEMKEGQRDLEKGAP